MRSCRFQVEAVLSPLFLLLALLCGGVEWGESQDGFELERMSKAHQIRAKVLGVSARMQELGQIGKQATEEDWREVERILSSHRSDLEGNPFFHLLRGEAHWRRGEETEAEKCWMTASDKAGDDLFVHWLLFRDLVPRNHWQAVRGEMEKIKDLKVRSGPNRMPMLATLTLQLSKDLERKDALGPAMEVLDLALFLDPEWGEARFAKARLLWKSGGLRLREIEREIGRGFVNLNRDEEDKHVLLVNLLYLIVLAILFSFLLFVTSLFVKYEPLLRHELAERLRISPTSASHSWPLALLYFFPLLLAGWGWQLFFWAFLVFPYCLRKEKLLLCLLSLSLLFLPFFYRYAAVVELARHNPLFRAAREVEAGLHGKGTARWLTSYVEEHPEEPLARFYYSLLLQREGRLEEARAGFEKCLEHLSDRSAVHNNLGNLYFQLGRYEEAEREYRKALELSPKVASTHLHLSLLYAFFPDRLRLEEAQSEFKKAEALEPGISSGIESYRELPKERFLTYQGLPLFDLAMAMEERFGERERLARSLWGDRIRYLSLALIPPFAYAFVGLLWISYWLRSRADMARLCPKCGQPFCNVCGKSTEVDQLCAGCFSAFFSPQIRDPRARIERLLFKDRNEERQRLRIRILAFFPGAASFYAQETWTGLLHGSLFLLLLFSLTGMGEMFPSPFHLSRLFPTAWLAGHLIGLFGLYAASLIRGWRWSP